MTADHVRRYIDFFERMEPGSLASVDTYFVADAHFVDPFNDVRGSSAIRRVFEHMFANCVQPRFEVVECVGDHATVYLRWRFSFGAAAARRQIDGVSRVQFAADGRALEHIDYWDPARQIYETIPLLGRLMRTLRRRLSTPLGNETPDAQLPTEPLNQRTWP